MTLSSLSSFIGNTQSDNPMQNFLTKKAITMQERIDRARERQQEELKAKLVEEQLENYDDLTGIDPAFTKAIVASDMAMSRTEDAYRARAGIISRMEREGATEELQEALALATAQLAARLGEVFNYINEYSEKKSSDQSDEQPEEDDAVVRTQQRLTNAYGNAAPPSGLVINTVS